MDVRELIEKTRESGNRELADTMDMMLESDGPFDVPPEEQPINPIEGLYFRAGIIMATELENRGTEAEKPTEREMFVQSLKEGGQRQLADACEYVWNNPEEVQDDDFDANVLPLSGPELSVFSVGLTFGMAYE